MAERASPTRPPAPAGATRPTTRSPARRARLHRRRHLHRVGPRDRHGLLPRGQQAHAERHQWRVTRGIRDSSNRDSLWYLDASPVTIGQEDHITFPTMPTEHIFKAGHQIGVIVGGSNAAWRRAPATTTCADHDRRQAVEDHPAGQGRLRALASAGGTDAETVAPDAGAAPPTSWPTTADARRHGRSTFTPPTATDNEDPNPKVDVRPRLGHHVQDRPDRRHVHREGRQRQQLEGDVQRHRRRSTRGRRWHRAATLALTLGAPVQFGAFTPGVAKEYTASRTATVLSTAGDATLSVADPSPTNTGKLVNGTFALARPCRASASSRHGARTAPPRTSRVPMSRSSSRSRPTSRCARARTARR